MIETRTSEVSPTRQITRRSNTVLLTEPLVSPRTERQAPPTSPEDIIWRGFSPNAKLAGSVLGIMGSSFMTSEAVAVIMKGYTGENPQAQVQATAGLEELRRVGVVKRETLLEASQDIVARYEEKFGPSAFFKIVPKTLKEEYDFVKYSVSRQLITDFYSNRKDDDAFKRSVTEPRYSLNPDYKQYALASLPKAS